jgi:hypothetical protein
MKNDVGMVKCLCFVCIEMRKKVLKIRNKIREKTMNFDQIIKSNRNVEIRNKV